MKRLAIVCTLTLLLLAGGSFTLYAQDHPQDHPDEKPQPEQNAKPPKPKADHPDHAKPVQAQDNRPEDRRMSANEDRPNMKPQQDENRRAQEQNQQEQKAQEKQQKDQMKHQQDQAKHQQQEQEKQNRDNAKRAQEQAQHNQKEQQNQAREDAKRDQHQDHDARGAHPANANFRGRRIPDDRFRQHFGREHHFRVQRVTIVENHPRFYYSDYWFQLAEPWPMGWSYDDDDYIDYVDDGYYLFDPIHPGIRIAVFVVE